MLAQSLTSEQDEEVQKEFEGLEQQLLQKEADQLPAAPTVSFFCAFPSLPACCGAHGFASLQRLLAASHCLARLWEGSDVQQRVCPCPFEHQLLHEGAGKLPTATLACHNQLPGRAIDVHRPADVYRLPIAAIRPCGWHRDMQHPCLQQCVQVDYLLLVLSLERPQGSQLSAICQGLNAAPYCPAAQGGGSHHSRGRDRPSACTAAAHKRTNCDCRTSQLAVQPIFSTPFCTIDKQRALPNASYIQISCTPLAQVLHENVGQTHADQGLMRLLSHFHADCLSTVSTAFVRSALSFFLAA